MQKDFYVEVQKLRNDGHPFVIVSSFHRFLAPLP
jgi:hypothetical protein